jgi:hypothetical protein
MLADNIPPSSSATFEGPEPNGLILEVLNFVELRLIQLSKRFSHISPEKGLTFELVNLLQCDTYKEPCPFWFHDGYLEDSSRGDSREPDIGVMPKETVTIKGKSFPYNKSFFSIEAKILPTPGSDREKEYLIGRQVKGNYKYYGGVERFKKELHGKDLEHAGLIGYIKQRDFKYWQVMVNSWIDELIISNHDISIVWTDDDKLIEQYANPLIARFISSNKRQNDEIALFHLWVKLGSPTN